MSAAPVDILIIGFPGNKFTGRIAPAITELVENGTIRILDLLFVSKDAEGNVASLTIQDLDSDFDPGFVGLEIAEPGVLDQNDALELDEDLEPNSSALLVAYENTWAAKFVAACRAADAVVLDQVRIPADAVAEVLGAR